MHDARLEVRDRARPRARRRSEWFCGPRAGRAELSQVRRFCSGPRAASSSQLRPFPAAAALRAERIPSSCEGQLRDRIVTMDEDRVRRDCRRSEGAVATRLHRKDPRALVIPLVLEGVHRAAHQREIARCACRGRRSPTRYLEPLLERRRVVAAGKPFSQRWSSAAIWPVAAQADGAGDVCAAGSQTTLVARARLR